MLTVTRKSGQAFVINDEITIKITQIQGKQVKISIDAPRSIAVLRQELINTKDKSDHYDAGSKLEANPHEVIS